MKDENINDQLRNSILNRKHQTINNFNFIQEQDDQIEKARAVGDMHSNGKWVWTEYKPGKFDWRNAPKGKLSEKDLDIARVSNCPIMEEETYLSINGASRQDIGDSAFHKNKGNNSDKTWSKMVNAQAEKDRKLIIRREELRKEYWQKVENGEFRPPTRNEKLILTANGNPDNECVIAARRLLGKKGINWQQS